MMDLDKTLWGPEVVELVIHLRVVGNVMVVGRMLVIRMIVVLFA